MRLAPWPCVSTRSATWRYSPGQSDPPCDPRPGTVPDLPAAVHLVELAEPSAAAQRLYSILHECDALNLDVIVIVMPPDQPEWRTIRDRLVRATRPVTGQDGEVDQES